MQTLSPKLVLAAASQSLAVSQKTCFGRGSPASPVLSSLLLKQNYQQDGSQPSTEVLFQVSLLRGYLEASSWTPSHCHVWVQDRALAIWVGTSNSQSLSVLIKQVPNLFSEKRVVMSANSKIFLYYLILSNQKILFPQLSRRIIYYPS